jgi:hypothetical protein
MISIRLREGSVELSTLQALTILILIDYTAGQTMRAGWNIRSAVYLLQNLKIGSSELPDLENERDERLLWRWSLYMLGNLIGEPTAGLGFKLAHTSPSNKKNFGIVGCTIQLSEVWGMAQSYASSLRLHKNHIPTHRIREFYPLEIPTPRNTLRRVSGGGPATATRLLESLFILPANFPCYPLSSQSSSFTLHAVTQFPPHHAAVIYTALF